MRSNNNQILRRGSVLLRVTFTILAVLLLFDYYNSKCGAQTSRFVTGVPDCGETTYESGNLFVVNVCDIDVYVHWTSDGNVWGGTNLGPHESQNTGESSEAVNRAGGVRLFTCPGNSTPEDTQGQPVGPHYRGPYRCRR